MKTFVMSCSSIALLIGVGLLGSPRPAAAEEWEQYTPYYEDDAWYDISEWFDGNDYNPTDEVIGRWDDEVYQASDDTGSDVDNDWGLYADGSTEDDWFYDYYEPTYQSQYSPDVTNDTFRYVTHYYDFDDDDLYDACLTYYDEDGDGFYEDVDYMSFNDTAKQSKNQDKPKKDAESEVSRNSRSYTLAGTVEKTKSVDVGDKKHTVALVKSEDTDKSFVVDLGPKDQADDLKLKSNKKITFRGPVAKIGKVSIVMARSVEMDGESKSIDRSATTRKGKVVDTRKVQLRGKKHLLAIIKSTKKKDNKLAVDLGLAKKVDSTPKKGDQIEVSGIPVKAKDKTVLVAQSFRHNGEKHQIDRSQKRGKMATTAKKDSSEKTR